MDNLNFLVYETGWEKSLPEQIQAAADLDLSYSGPKGIYTLDVLKYRHWIGICLFAQQHLKVNKQCKSRKCKTNNKNSTLKEISPPIKQNHS